MGKSDSECCNVGVKVLGVHKTAIERLARHQLDGITGRRGMMAAASEGEKGR